MIYVLQGHNWDKRTAVCIVTDTNWQDGGNI